MTRAELYLALTEAMAAAKPKGDGIMLTQWEADCCHIAAALSAHHEGFDRTRFLAECGSAPPSAECVSRELREVLEVYVDHYGVRPAEQLLLRYGAPVFRCNLSAIPAERRPALLADMRKALAPFGA